MQFIHNEFTTDGDRILVEVAGNKYELYEERGCLVIRLYSSPMGVHALAVRPAGADNCLMVKGVRNI